MRFHYTYLDNCGFANGTVIVIDVLRAFSTAAYAFNAGAENITLVSSVEEALYLKEAQPGLFVMGEEGGLPPAGFDSGNSPSIIRRCNLAGKRLVQRTSAGTQGVVRCIAAQTLLAASFVVARATVQYVLKSETQDVTFVITGGEKNAEDLACAEYLEELLQGRTPDPEPFVRRVYESQDAACHLDPARPEFPESDLDYCTRINAFQFAMLVSREGDQLVLRKVA